MNMRMIKAEPGDLPSVLHLLTERAAWMRERGSRQWSGDLLAPERIAGIIAEGGTWLAMAEDATPLGTITLSEHGDPDFWTADERTWPAIYISKMATALDHGHGLGKPMLRWAVHRAADKGVPWVRLDVIRDPEATRLRQWYVMQGFTPLQTVVVEGKNSGALFQRRSVLDPDAALAFIPATDHPERLFRLRIPEGSRVFADYYGPGSVTEVEDVDAGTEHVLRDDPVRRYRVLLDTGRALWCTDLELEPDGAMVP